MLLLRGVLCVAVGIGWSDWMLREFEDTCKVRVARKIAAGGMGTVYEAVQVGADGFEKRVAVKEILPTLSRNPRFVEMFVAEAKLVADLVHENIVQIYQLNEHDRGYYIIMEYVHGLSLADFISQHGSQRLPVELAVFIASRIARGLAYAHSRRDAAGRPMHIVHRDVCPKNILITTEGLPKLVDFGIANAVTSALADSKDSVALGKSGYMSPEQAWNRPVDHRSDAYSLGLVLFEMLRLKPARLKWSSNLLYAASKGWIEWDALPRRIPSKLRRLLERMLAYEPDDRHGTTDELAHDLEYYIYRKGYGPTIVTLEKYMRQLWPALYGLCRPGAAGGEGTGKLS